MWTKMRVCTYGFISLAYVPRRRIVDHMLILCLQFGGTASAFHSGCAIPHPPPQRCMRFLESPHPPPNWLLFVFLKAILEDVK